jgi:hypothetical protein
MLAGSALHFDRIGQDPDSSSEKPYPVRDPDPKAGKILKCLLFKIRKS